MSPAPGPAAGRTLLIDEKAKWKLVAPSRVAGRHDGGAGKLRSIA
ncbi:hypothetical protein ACFSC3_10905 [Sphingomonas floccifaciens]|uniref:Uncharacterized protein n=1 Tax=Sphingomonas floccifaciens TaxID=1844115 RepID=A0ABW4ND58_9SPHN